eukprot:TRINITY_DN4496_c0_g3_i3.p1 TRINITY_DN4496_c0_g3~~TRINITY_DN4496_c0_g3_i3.p1  ORF type:complete len:837 (+),score=147.54 TRINITY_DN4496_c0_g3_i3:128-2512(+)
MSQNLEIQTLSPTKSKAWPENLKCVVTCGEALLSDTVADFSACSGKTAELHNLYGPTEGSMTWWPCLSQKSADAALFDSRRGQQVPIGLPIDNTSVLLLDKWQRVVPIGIPGEINFGHCVAQGYLGQPELTLERFIPNPVPEEFTQSGMLASPTLYRTGDIAVRLETGELRFIGRADRQVKVRGFRIELGAVESAILSVLHSNNFATADTSPGPKDTADGNKKTDISAAVAVIALASSDERPGGELVGFVEFKAGKDSDFAEKMRKELLKILPAYSVPSRILALQSMPRLVSGKVDLRSLTQLATQPRTSPSQVAEVTKKPPPVPAPSTAEAEEPMHKVNSKNSKFEEEIEEPEAQLAVDSLGVMRRQLAGSKEQKLAEDRLADNMRAFLMFGVIMDHWAGCADSSMCSLVVEGMIWQQPAEVQPQLASFEVVVRSIGNYKCMSGFMMISAYADSAFDDASRWSKADLVVLLTYLQMLWVLDPLVWVACHGTHPEWCSDDENMFAGIHRWYLLVMLVIKVCHVIFRIGRVPPFLQCMLITILAFTLPAELGCLTDTKCSTSGDSDFWKENYKSLGFLWKFLLQGAWEDTQNMFSSAFMRYYVLFIAQYFWTFHYGRTVVGKVRKAMSKEWWWKASIVSSLMLLISELLNTGLLGPQLYAYMQEQVLGTSEPRFGELLCVNGLLMLQVALLAMAFQGLPRRAKLLGSTTLGCYVIHMYFTYPIMVIRPHFLAIGNSLGLGGFTMQLVILLALPLLFQVSIGAAFHKVLLFQQRLLFKVFALLMRRVSALYSKRRR